MECRAEVRHVSYQRDIHDDPTGAGAVATSQPSSDAGVLPQAVGCAAPGRTGHADEIDATAQVICTHSQSSLEWDARVEDLVTRDKAGPRIDVRAADRAGDLGNTGWPPYESDAFHEATVAAMAIGVAPGWLDMAETDPALVAKIERLKTYLRNTPSAA